MTDNTPDHPPVYRPSVAGTATCLCQGEILTGLVRNVLDLDTIGDKAPRFIPVRHLYSLIVSQACDLDWDFRARLNGNRSDKLVPSIIFCDAMLAQVVRQDNNNTSMNSTVWNNIKINRDVRYQFLQEVHPIQDLVGDGIKELCLDFKRYFTIPTEEVYRRIEMGEARRRSVLLSPYVEHLSDRFAHFLSRVGLPRDHESEKAS